MSGFSTHPQPRRIDFATKNEGLFDDVVTLPNSNALTLYGSLVGLDALKTRLLREGQVILHPDLFSKWQKKHHPAAIDLISMVRGRPPLFIFEGDVGTGKTALARTFGDAIARAHEISVHLHVLSLNARGSGAVGEMTRLISEAFAAVRTNTKSSAPSILLIDEADALAQNRNLAQMHHEDRAGVNALIRGIDSLSEVSKDHPILVVMCTNRIDAVDPAVQRRAAGIFRFERPSLEQRVRIFERVLKPAGFLPRDIQALANATGETAARKYGFTYSDITQRLLPELILESLPDSPIEPKKAIELAKSMEPTPPFGKNSSEVR
jgi:SpoVK/Ycf46/Vps4 family AAA+-type ATPase